MSQPDTIETVLHSFKYDIRNPAEKAVWKTLKAKLAGIHRMHSFGEGSHEKPNLDGRTVKLETRHLFDNQWNTAPIDGISDKGLRVFDFATDAIFGPSGVENKYIKRGHWLEQTEAMYEVRHNNVTCGFCGHMQRIEAATTFCDRCLENEYLQEKHLHLLRLLRIDDRSQRPPLTDLERQLLEPKFTEAQIHGTSERGKARRARERQKLEADYKKATDDAKTEHDGMLWLWEHGINTDNVIFYDHTGVFCFGWRKPCDSAFTSRLLEEISEFNFPYEIKTEDGRKLNGNIG
jgi:hypothetical protein